MAHSGSGGYALERTCSIIMDYEFKTDEQSRAFCNKIAERMVSLFNISVEEAVGRMNRLWSGQSFIGPKDLIYHEDEDFWANDIFYGGDSLWWANPPGLKPLPFP